MSTIYNTHKTLLPKNGPPSLREALRQSTPPVGRSVAITLAVAFTAIFAVRVYRKFLRIPAKRTSSLTVARSVIRAVQKDLQHSALTPFKSRYPRSAADITPESLVLPKIFARFPAFPAPLNLSQRAFVCWDLAVYNSCKEVTIYVPLDTFWRFHMARSVKKQMQVPSERIAAAPSLSACLTLISDEPWSEGGMVRAADTDPVCADALVHSHSDAISSVDNLQVIFRTADAVDHVPCVKPSDTVCVSSTPPRRSGQRVIRKGPVPPKHTEPDATSNAVSSESTAASAPRITAAPVGRLKTASVDFVLFLAWKVISQKRVVPRPRRRFRPSREFLQRVVCQHVKYNTRVAASAATPHALKVYASPAVPRAPPAASAPVLPSSPKEIEFRTSTAARPAGKLTASPRASASEPRLSRNNLLRPSPNVSIRGKQLYGARKSLRSQPLRVPRLQAASSGSDDSFASNAHSAGMCLDARPSRAGELC